MFSLSMTNPPVRMTPGIARRGFTLIEVLIATFIFALGLLGLLALFAGAAVQQQAASQVTNSVFASNAAEAIVGRVAGRLEYRDANNLPNPTEFDNLVPQDQWKVLTHSVTFPPNNPSRIRGTLQLKPEGMDNNASFFFVAPAPEQLPLVLYDRPDQITQSGSGTYTRTGNQQPFTNRVKGFAVSRVHRESLNFIVVRTEEGTVPDPSSYRDIFYTRRDDLPAGYTNMVSMVAFSPSTHVPSNLVDPNDYIVINLGERDGHLPPPPRAFVEGFQIADVNASGGARRVDSISVPFYEWRNSDIVSIDDRVVYRPDDTRPDGRRPVLCYSLLYRRTSSNTTQVAVFTYSLKAPSPRAVFMPAESESGGDGSPLIRVNVELGYDAERSRYYIEMTDGQGIPSIVQDRSFALRTGAVLLIAGQNDGDPAGSDLPVRVIEALDIDGDGDIDRGYLDRGPRANGEAYIDITSTGTMDLPAWMVSPSIESRDQSIWRLEPIDTRVLQTG